MPDISIQNAAEGNLKGITLDIPKERLVVFTGLSGSGKSTLLVDVLFNECQRQYLEAMGLEGIRKPMVERICNVSPAILISQTDVNKNPRSTVGTLTNLYTDLRMVFEKLAVRACPHCGGQISAADCREETEKIDDEFKVYMYCSLCGKRMDKLTRTDFSFNTKEGACPRCEGLGRVLSVNRALAVDEALAPEHGAVRWWEQRYGEYQAAALHAAFRHFGVRAAPHTPVAQFSAVQKAIFYDGVACDAVRRAFPDIAPPKTVASGRFDGMEPMLWKKLAEHGGDKRLEAYFDTAKCPSCGGERLNALSRGVTVNGTRLPQLSALPLEHVCAWVADLRAMLGSESSALVADYLRDIETKLRRFLNVGLGYLALDRQTVTLSGGELQRVRLAAVLDSDLSGVIYILDEPTVGLHPRDTAGLVTVLEKLRDRGNTVLVIEHDPDVMAAADYIVDLGPGSGRHGGQVAGAGTLAQIKAQPASPTGCWLSTEHPGKRVFRAAAGAPVQVRGAAKFNLQHVDVDIPKGCLSVVTGPSGSGKSTLVFELVAKGDHSGPEGTVSGCAQFGRVVEIGQAAIAKMKRSNVATYSEAYAGIRRLFAATDDAKQMGLAARHFSFNTAGGRCETCEGLGYVVSNMLFFTDIEAVCPACGGRRFTDEVLAVRYRGRGINDVLACPVEEAAELFADDRQTARILNLLLDVGLGYLELGQTLTTLSGGECQRLKLAKELVGSRGQNSLYLMDEPTTGLHPQDVAHFLVLLGRMVDAGNTVVVVEHNAQIIQNSDWVIDLGPDGGDKGGRVMFTGTPAGLLHSNSITAKFLR